ncbi:hypothetical protein DFH27DRAFT_520641 [Peziza echinospora]|nr:hypothetical protein DFH27DRAFT_520641 [Peziza echinospora]
MNSQPGQHFSRGPGVPLPSLGMAPSHEYPTQPIIQNQQPIIDSVSEDGSDMVPVYRALGVTPTTQVGVYASHDDGVHKAFRSWLAHLLKFGPGPFERTQSSDFNAASWEWLDANLQSMAMIRLAPHEEAQLLQRRTANVAQNLHSRMEFVMAKLQSCYEAALQVATKYNHSVPTGGLHSPISTLGGESVSRIPTLAQLNAADFKWTNENYHEYPLPTTLISQINRIQASPAWNAPIHPSSGWRYSGYPADCETVPGHHWVPPTSCPVARIRVVHQIYAAMLNAEDIHDRGSRVLKKWEGFAADKVLEDGSGTGRQRLEMQAWKLALRLHKVFRFDKYIAIKTKKQSFFAALAELVETMRTCKGTVLQVTKENVQEMVISRAKEKMKTFIYNLDSNERKKARERDHLKLHRLVHGTEPPWKQGKTRQPNADGLTPEEEAAEAEAEAAEAAPEPVAPKRKRGGAQKAAAPAPKRARKLAPAPPRGRMGFSMRPARGASPPAAAPAAPPASPAAPGFASYHHLGPLQQSQAANAPQHQAPLAQTYAFGSGLNPQIAHAPAPPAQSYDNYQQAPASQYYSNPAPQATYYGNQEPQANYYGHQDPQASYHGQQDPQANYYGQQDPQASYHGQQDPQANYYGQQDPQVDNNGYSVQQSPASATTSSNCSDEQLYYLLHMEVHGTPGAAGAVNQTQQGNADSGYVIDPTLDGNNGQDEQQHQGPWQY